MYSVTTHNISKLDSYSMITNGPTTKDAKYKDCLIEWAATGGYLRHEYTFRFMFRAGLEYWLSVPSSIEDKANDNDIIERQSIVFDKNVYIVANGISKISKARRLSTYGYDIRYWTEDSKELVRLVKEPPESYKRLTRQFDLGYPEVVDNDDYFGGVSEPVQDYVLNNSRFLAVWVKEATLDAKGREDYYSSKYDYLDRKTLGMESTDLDNILQTELYNYLGERLNRYGSHMKRSRNVLVK